MQTADYLMLDSTTRQRILRYNPQEVFWSTDNDIFPKVFVAFVQMFSHKTASSLKNSALVVYPVHAVLLNFNNACKRWLRKSRHILAAFLSVACSPEMEGIESALPARE